MLKKSNDKILTGVCAGIAEEFGIDPLIVRLGFLIGLFFSVGTAGFVYLILALLMPRT